MDVLNLRGRGDNHTVAFSGEGFSTPKFESAKVSLVVA
jgi:hypothetical protein